MARYYGWYVVAAELFDAPLGTLDDRLANSPRPPCQLLLPPAATRTACMVQVTAAVAPPST